MRVHAGVLAAIVLSVAVLAGVAVARPAPAGAGTVPAGFRPASVSFVTARLGFVLGAGQDRRMIILRTGDRGATWRRTGAPPATAGGSAIRFATASRGFVFGGRLWTTTDGGARWVVTAKPAGPVTSLEIVRGQVLAVAGGMLYRRALDGGPWHRSGTATSGISVGAGVAAVVSGTGVLVSTDGGRTIRRHVSPCGRATAEQPVAVAVRAPRGLALACTGQGFGGNRVKTMYLSDDLGVTWRGTGQPPVFGNIDQVAAAEDGHLVISEESFASWLYYSPDDGLDWRSAVMLNTGGQEWTDLVFVTGADGAVILGSPVTGDGDSRLFVTDDGGVAWRPVRF